MNINDLIDLNVTLGYLDKASLCTTDAMKYTFRAHGELVLAPERREKLIQLISENENVSRTSADYIVDLVLNNLAQVMV